MAFFSLKKNKENVAQKSVSGSVKTTKAGKGDKANREVESKRAGGPTTEKTATKMAAKVAMPKSVGSAVDLSHDLAALIVRPRVTEKATMSAENGAYVFEVIKDSSKDKIAKAVAVMYKVTPRKVRIVNLPKKSVFIRGKWGTKTAVKKAYVYLKKGEKIDII